jgi:glycosyltransferase involved in cell wall biosynthesis
MAAGTPVIGSRCGGITEQIVDGVSGILFCPGEAADLAEALHSYLIDPGLREHAAEEGRRRVRNMFRLESTFRSMAALFDRVARPQVDASLQDSPL